MYYPKPCMVFRYYHFETLSPLKSCFFELKNHALMDQKPHDLMNQSAIGLKFLNQKLMRSCSIGPWASDPAVIRVISIKAIKPAVLLGLGQNLTYNISLNQYILSS